MRAVTKLGTYPVKFVKRPRFYTMRLLGRFVTVQRLVRRLPSRTPAFPTGGGTSVFPDLNVAAAVATLQRDGLLVGLKLPAEIIDEIRAYAETATCYANFDPTLGFPIAQVREAEAKIGRRIVAAEYFNASLDCAAIKQLSSDTKLLELSTGYLGRPAKWMGSLLRWTFATDTTPKDMADYAQLFHFDLDDYSVLKFFFYITAVDDLSGPHVLVRGSHRTKRVGYRYYRPRSRLLDEQVERFYGRESLATLLGQAGTGFAMDPFCIHKGTPPSGKPRLALQVQFVVTDYGFGYGVRDPAQLKSLL